MCTVTKGFAPIVVIILVVAAGAVVYFVSRDSAPQDGSKPKMTTGEGKQGAEMMSKRDSGEEIMANDSTKRGEMTDKIGESSTMEKTDSGSMMDSPEAVSYVGTVLAGSSAPLLDFTKRDYDAAFASEKLIVLYFYAEWCPVCKRETAEALHPAFNELSRQDVIGFRVNYNDGDMDTDEKALAREFGVAYQHTKIFLKDGKRVLKSPEGWDKERYLAEIAKTLEP